LEDLGVVSYSPLGSGLLTGKYQLSQKPKTGRLLKNKVYQMRYSAPWMQKTVNQFVRFAKDNHFSPAGLAVAWASSHPAVTAPIIGARNLDQLAEVLQSVNIDVTPEIRKKISAFSPEPNSATDRNEEGTAHSLGVR